MPWRNKINTLCGFHNPQMGCVMRLGIFTSHIREAPQGASICQTFQYMPKSSNGLPCYCHMFHANWETKAEYGRDLPHFRLHLGKCQRIEASRPGAACCILWVGTLGLAFSHFPFREGVPPRVQALLKNNAQCAQIFKKWASLSPPHLLDGRNMAGNLPHFQLHCGNVRWLRVAGLCA